MKIEVNHKDYQYITDNTKECDIHSAFLVTKQSEKYLETAKNSDTPAILTSNDLKDIFDLSTIKIVGVTGTNGKTTTSAAIYSILLDLGFSVAFQGTRGFYIDDAKIEGKSLTTPPLLVNYSHILHAIEAGCDYFIMEVSSHALVQERVEGLNFELKVLTNITSDHLDYHKTVTEYINVKNSFFSDESKKLINKDVDVVKYNYINAITYAIEEGGYCKINSYSLRGGITASIQYFQELAEFSSPMYGFFNLYNLQAAIASVKILTDLPLQQICDEVDNFAGVSGRLEVVSDKPLILIDFAHTEDGMKQVFDTFDDKPIVVVFGAGGDRDRTKRPLMGKMASHYATKIYLTDDNPRSEDPDLIIDDILIGIQNKNKVSIIADRPLAIQTAIKELKDDERLFILGKGDEETQEIDGKLFPMNDKTIVNEYLSK